MEFQEETAPLHNTSIKMCIIIEETLSSKFASREKTELREVSFLLSNDMLLTNIHYFNRVNLMGQLYSVENLLTLTVEIFQGIF